MLGMHQRRKQTQALSSWHLQFYLISQYPSEVGRAGIRINSILQTGKPDGGGGGDSLIIEAKDV